MGRFGRVLARSRVVWQLCEGICVPMSFQTESCVLAPDASSGCCASIPDWGTDGSHGSALVCGSRIGVLGSVVSSNSASNFDCKHTFVSARRADSMIGFLRHAILVLPVWTTVPVMFSRGLIVEKCSCGKPIVKQACLCGMLRVSGCH